MEDINNKFIIFNAQKNYKFLCKYLYDLQSHICYCHENNIINLYNKNIILGKIYELVKEINSDYNNFIINKIDYCKIILSKVIKFNFNDSDYEFIVLRDYIKNIYFIDYDDNLNKLLFPLDQNRNKILDLFNKYGSKNIYNIIEITLKLDVNIIFSRYTCIFLKFLNTCFIPLNFKILEDEFEKLNYEFSCYDPENECSEENFSDSDDCSIDSYLNDINISLKKINNDELLNKLVNIELRSPKGIISIDGVFNQDSVNIYTKTCQISNKFLYYKKKNLEKSLIKCRATRKFTKCFFKNLTIFEILSYNCDSNFINFVDSNYDKYIILIGKSFMSIMKDFIKKNNTITDMYTTIRLLLLGNEENINIAGLLFEITKDKKFNSNLIYNLIYKNLNYVSQIKLKKSVSDMKEELKKIQNMSTDDIDYKKQIVSLKNMPSQVKASALEKVEEMKSSGNEYYKQVTFVKTLLKFPWPSLNDDLIFHDLNKNLNKRKQFITNFDENIKNMTFGHTDAKKVLTQTVCKWITNPDSGGSALSFVGPPGVGKTLLAKSIGNSLNIPFAQITLGGQNDGELLHGHGYTYSGSQPGLIVKKMVELGKNRCILYFDELDKATTKNGSNEITNILIHLTDPNMNKNFQDRFFQGIDFPLDKVVMIFSYNDSSKIDPILLDRFREISIKPYSLSDKRCIFKEFMVKELCEVINFKKEDLIFDDECIDYLINNYTMEAGVRELKRKLEFILLNLNVDRIYQRNMFEGNNNAIKITKNLIKEILENPTLEITKINKESLVGVINGLYATNAGSGGIVPIQIACNFFNNDSPFSLRLTGSQGDVMKESVQCSLTCAIDYIERNKDTYQISNMKEYLENKWKSGFHVHAPSGATPKDGPSAGCAFTTGFISRILDKKIKNTIAMTGEIDLLGNVTKIGGLEYKINGGKKAGIKHFFISNENKKDYEKIKKNDPKLCKGITVKFVNTIDEIIPDALIFN